jgi:hypothetical protein
VQVVHRALPLVDLPVGGLESMRASPRWLLAVPIEEFADLGAESIRLFFTFTLQVLKVRQKSKEGAYLAAFGLPRKYGGMV